MKTHILIADDEPDVVQLLASNLIQAGFAVTAVEDGGRALECAREQKPSLIVLDVMMPNLSGFEVCKLLKRDNATQDIPVILVSARGGEIDRVLGFEIGADDYVTKPFSPRELVLRVQSILRRRTVARKPQTLLQTGGITMDLDRHQVLIGEAPVELTAVEFKLLKMMMEEPGKVQSREHILKGVWGFNHVVQARTVDTHMRRLRDKLGESARHIETIRSFGYRIKALET